MKTTSGHRLFIIAMALAAGFVLGRITVPVKENRAEASVDSTGRLTADKPVMPSTASIEDVLITAQNIHRHRVLSETLHAMLEPLPAVELVELAAAFSWEEKLTWQEAATCQVILECWLAQDTGAAQDWVGLLPARCREGSLAAFLSATAVTDPGKAVAWVQRIDSDGGGALPEIAGELAATDPQAALRLLQVNADTEDEDRYDELFEKWAEHNPAAAYAAAVSLPKSDARISALSQVFLQWSLLDRAAAYAAALALPKGELQIAALKEVLDTWAGQEPKEALAAARSLPKELQRGAVRSVLSGWARSDPAAAAPAVAALPLTERKDLNNEIADAWTKSDPQAVLAWAKTLSEKEGGEEVTGGILSFLAKTDGPAAAAAWASLSLPLRANGLASVMPEWSARDFDGAMQWARSLDHPRDRENAISWCMTNLDFSQGDRISAILNELPPGDFRQSAISILTAKQLDKDVAGTLKFLSTVSPEERAGTMAGYGVLDALAEGDVRQVLALLAETPGLAPTSFDWQRVVEKLAAEDPAEALQWAVSLTRADAKKNALDTVLTTWAQTDGPEAMRQAHLLSDPELQKEISARVLYGWAEQDPDAVLQWAKTAPAAERDEAVLRGALGKAENDPAAGAAIIDSLLKESSTDSWIPGLVAEKWFFLDINAACDWTLRLPPGAAQNEAVSRIVGTWAQSDAMAASKWVRELSPGIGRDEAAMSLIRGIKVSDPGSAFTWANSISDGDQRNEAIRIIAESLDELSTEAARAAVVQSSLPAQKKQEILETLPKE